MSVTNLTDLQLAPRRTGAGTQGLDEAHDLAHSERLDRIRRGELATIHSWELVTAVDGPGTRLTIFFSGCPLRCLYLSLIHISEPTRPY